MTVLMLVEFADAARFIEAARRARNARYRLADAFSPFPVDGMLELLQHRPSRIRIAIFIGGIATAAAAYGLEYFSAVINYPYNSGGRPLDAWPAFMLVPFATGILVACIAGLGRFLFECGLPRLYHPLFADEGFERASQDRFILALECPLTDDEHRHAIELLRSLGAIAFREVKT